MTQHISPNQPDSPRRHDANGGQPAHEAFGVVAADNPYARRHDVPAPDLDAGAPVLKSSELQRLNRKALLFLASIVALLVVMAVWMFHSATAGDDVAAKPREEKVVIPELPQEPEAAAARASAEPIGLASDQAAAMADLPPLPENPVASSPQPSYVHSDFAGSSPHEPTLRERRMGALETRASAQPGSPDGYAQAMLASLAQAGGASQPSASPVAVATSARYLEHPDSLLVRGTYVRCVLETRIVTDIPGFTSCVVTEPVYSINGARLLLPKGSKVSGRYDTEPNGPRVSVVWDRITTPNGIDVNMASPGVDNLGGAGHPGDYDAHWGSRIASALMISLLSDAFKYAAAENGPRTTSISNGVITQSPYESGTARTMERLADQALDKGMRRPATVTINQGTVVNVYVAKDIDFAGVLARQ